MTDLDYLYQRLDSDPADRFTLLVIADYLSDHGKEAEADAWRWLHREGKEPYNSLSSFFWGRRGLRSEILPWLDSDLFWSPITNPHHRLRSEAFRFAAAEFVARGWHPAREEVRT